MQTSQSVKQFKYQHKGEKPLNSLVKVGEIPGDELDKKLLWPGWLTEEKNYKYQGMKEKIF